MKLLRFCLKATLPLILSVAQVTAAGLTPAEALALLLSGNERYAQAQRTYPHQAAERRVEISKRQMPFAIVVGCSDSRVPPEIVFDQGLGDLFTVRLAGECCDDVAIGSIEYAISHFDTPLVLVLGHEKCGAVEAAMQSGKGEGHITALLDAIRPAIAGVALESGHDKLDSAVRANVRHVVKRLRSSGPQIAERLRNGALDIVGAEYSLSSGAVEILKAVAP